MKLTSTCFADNGRIPGDNAFCIIDPKTHVAMSKNRNPDLSWSGVPSGTKSLALICHDPDVPSKGDDVNKEGRTVPASLPRVDFYHWVLVDLAPDAAAIKQGEFADGVTPRGKSGPAAQRDARDVERVAVSGIFTGADVRKAMQGHVLGEARLTGIYALNPAL